MHMIETHSLVNKVKVSREKLMLWNLALTRRKTKLCALAFPLDSSLK